ncbi:MAG: thioredoxin domain-containing protein, partial [Succinivibrio sp.]
ENVRTVADQILSSDSLPFIGSKDARHYVIEFFDYECGYCKVMEPMFEKAVAEKSLKVYYVNIPVIKQESKQLALIAQAVFNIDPKAFNRIHSTFMQPGHIDVSEESVRELLKKESISWDAVKKELSSGAPQKQITENIQKSMTLNLAGTPYLIIDGQEYRGAITSYDTLMQLIE